MKTITIYAASNAYVEDTGKTHFGIVTDQDFSNNGYDGILVDLILYGFYVSSDDSMIVFEVYE